MRCVLSEQKKNLLAKHETAIEQIAIYFSTKFGLSVQLQHSNLNASHHKT